MGEAHIGHEWDSTKESTSEENEKVATIAIHKSSPTQGSSTSCLMMTTTPITFVS